MNKLFVLVAVASLAPSFAMAAQKAQTKPQDPQHHHYNAKDPISPNQGSDSCGLGWQVTDKRTFLGTTTRGTTDSFLTPFGMTSGTWGCEQHEFAKRDQEAAIYASSNMQPLSVEMAEGRGEFLQGFARTLGCDGSAMGAFGQMTQKNYETLSGARTGAELLQSVKQGIAQDPVLSAGCVPAV
jgi:hypothetical protein